MAREIIFLLKPFSLVKKQVKSVFTTILFFSCPQNQASSQILNRSNRTGVRKEESFVGIEV